MAKEPNNAVPTETLAAENPDDQMQITIGTLGSPSNWCMQEGDARSWILRGGQPTYVYLCNKLCVSSLQQLWIQRAATCTSMIIPQFLCTHESKQDITQERWVVLCGTSSQFLLNLRIWQ